MLLGKVPSCREFHFEWARKMVKGEMYASCYGLERKKIMFHIMVVVRLVSICKWGKYL